MLAPVRKLGSKVENFNRGKFSHRMIGIDSCVLIMYFANAILKRLTSTHRQDTDEASTIAGST